MQVLDGLAPLAPGRFRAVVLGSMPSAASLAAGEYYAHPQNAFWRLLGQLHGFSPQLPYADRCRRLGRAGIAVWDVIGQCVRPGSLDAAIRPDSVVVNDLAGWLRGQPVAAIGLNGATAATLFKRHWQARLLDEVLPPSVRIVRLPSSSPANARYSFEQKLAAWREGLAPARR